MDDLERREVLATAMANYFLKSKDKTDTWETLGENHRLAWRNNAEVALRAHDAALAAAGYAIVPVEPTEEMVNAVLWVSTGRVSGKAHAADTYRAMLAAAPGRKR